MWLRTRPGGIGRLVQRCAVDYGVLQHLTRFRRDGQDVAKRARSCVVALDCDADRVRSSACENVTLRTADYGSAAKVPRCIISRLGSVAAPFERSLQATPLPYSQAGGRTGARARVSHAGRRRDESFHRLSLDKVAHAASAQGADVGALAHPRASQCASPSVCACGGSGRLESRTQVTTSDFLRVLGL